MNIKQVCKSYFSPLESLRSSQPKNCSKVAIAALKVFSYLTLISPLIVGATYGTVCLLGRIKSQTKPQQKNSFDEIEKTGEGYLNRGKQYELGVGVSNELSNAQIDAGVSHYDNQDYAAALETFEQAAALQHPVANYRLGYMYLEGKGVTKDADKATQYFKQAAELGHVVSRTKLGVLHYKAGDKKKAFDCFKEAADGGEKVAQYYVAAMYFYQHTTEITRDRAFVYLIKSAGQNLSEARDLLNKVAQKNNRFYPLNAKK
ncbi:hypothetical protein PHSC3_000097 [Chlamydiales bacterium STE3]|nr:hypothetical protein PHSC3_000097 [Chlamydiales bacterium STE3]